MHGISLFLRPTVFYPISKPVPPIWTQYELYRWGVTFDAAIVDSNELVQPPFKCRNSKSCSFRSLTLVERTFKWLAKVLIWLCLCAGWSEALLAAYTMEISCHNQIKLFALCDLMIYNQSSDAIALSIWMEKQCGSWSAGFIRSQLIWIHTVFKRWSRILKKLCAQCAY